MDWLIVDAAFTTYFFNVYDVVAVFVESVIMAYDEKLFEAVYVSYLFWKIFSSLHIKVLGWLIKEYHITFGNYFDKW